MTYILMYSSPEVKAMLRSIVAIVLCIGLYPQTVVASPSVVYKKVKHGSTYAHTCIVDLTNPDVKVSVAIPKNGVGSQENFKTMVNRTKCNAAITGTFFDTKSLIPTGDIATMGRVVHYGCIGYALCVDFDNKASIVGIKEGRKTNWAGYETVLCGGPRLLSNGKIALALKHEGFTNYLHSRARRTAVGLTDNGKMVMVCINRETTLYTLAKLMKNMGVTDALTLDGGSSTGFYHQGYYYATPGRTMTNLLVVYSTQEKYAKAQSSLAPPSLIAYIDKKMRAKKTSGIAQVITDAALPLAHATVPNGE